MGYELREGNCLNLLREIPSDSIDCCVTGPPYWKLRDYGMDEQIGWEDTPEQFIANLVQVFAEVRRILKPTGTLWMNLGDSYRDKQLMGIPWRVALALQADGWFLRQDVIWNKPYTTPEPVTDRCVKTHEYIFLLSKSKNYYFDADAIKEPSVEANRKQRVRALELAKEAGLTPEHFAAVRACGISDVGKAQVTQDGFGKNRPEVQALAEEAKVALGGYYRELTYDVMKNKRSVWTVQVQKYKGNHHAAYPELLIEPAILAGCPQGGTILDPFTGTGTTAVVSLRHGRDFIGLELNPEYIRLAHERIATGGAKTTKRRRPRKLVESQFSFEF